MFAHTAEEHDLCAVARPSGDVLVLLVGVRPAHEHLASEKSSRIGAHVILVQVLDPLRQAQTNGGHWLVLEELKQTELASLQLIHLNISNQ